MGFRAELHPEAGVLIFRDFADESCLRVDFGQIEAILWWPTCVPVNSISVVDPLDGAGLSRDQALQLAQVLIEAAGASEPGTILESGGLRDFLDGFGEVTLKR